MPATQYDKKFFDSQSVNSVRSARRILPVVLGALKPRSLLDVGCGKGGWLNTARASGVEDIFGVDGAWAREGGLLIEPERFLAHDLSRPFDLERRFDMAMTIEVAEHLGAASADVFVDNLARHSGVVLFSAALPGQGGRRHVNEQPLGFWVEKFAERRYVFLDLLRPYFWADAEIGACYRQNLVLFAQDHCAATVRQALAARTGEPSFSGIVDFVHPRLLQERAEFASFSRVHRLKLAVKLLISVMDNSYRWSV